MDLHLLRRAVLTGILYLPVHRFDIIECSRVVQVVCPLVSTWKLSNIRSSTCMCFTVRHVFLEQLSHRQRAAERRVEHRTWHPEQLRGKVVMNTKCQPLIRTRGQRRRRSRSPRRVYRKPSCALIVCIF